MKLKCKCAPKWNPDYATDYLLYGHTVPVGYSGLFCLMLCTGCVLLAFSCDLIFVNYIFAYFLMRCMENDYKERSHRKVK